MSEQDVEQPRHSEKSDVKVRNSKEAWCSVKYADNWSSKPIAT